jgi:hypothetical protein
LGQYTRVLKLVAGGGYAGRFHRFGQTTADGAQQEGRNVALGFNREIRGFARKFDAAIEMKTTFSQKLSGEAGVGGAIHSPKPELFLVALEELEGFLELLHSAVERPSKEEDAKTPGVARVLYAKANAILAGLVAFNAAAIVVTDGGYTRGHRFGHEKIPKVIVWAGAVEGLGSPEVRSASSKPEPDTNRLTGGERKGKGVCCENIRLLLSATYI